MVNARVVVEIPTHHHGDLLLDVFANASEDFLICHTDSPDIDPYQVREVAMLWPCSVPDSKYFCNGKTKLFFPFIMFYLKGKQTIFSIVLLMMFWLYEIGEHSFVLAVG